MTDKPVSRLYRFGRAILTWSAVIASIATIISLWLQLRASSPVIDATILSREQLTSPPQEKSIKVIYSFNERPVTNLWKVNLQFRHAGGQTIVGSGPKQTLIGGYIPINVKDDFEIVDFSISKNSLEAKVDKISANELAITFDQWRKDEVLGISLFLENKKGNNLLPTSFSSGRSIVDGTVNYIFLEGNGTTQIRKPLLDYLPLAVSLSTRILLSLLAIIFLVGGAGIFISTIRDIRREKKAYEWNKTYRDAALNFLSTFSQPDALQILKAESFIVSRFTRQKLLGRNDSNLWDGFSGPAPDSLRWLDEDIKKPGADLLSTTIGSIVFVMLSILLILTIWSW
jgi:hypothetical protein